MDIKHSILNFCYLKNKTKEENNKKEYELKDSCLIVGNKNSNVLLLLFNYIYNIIHNCDNSHPVIWLITSKNSNEIQQSIPKYYFYDQKNSLVFNSVEINQNSYCQLIISYETSSELIQDDTVSESKYVIDVSYDQSLPYTYHPIDIINQWIPYRIILKGKASEDFELNYSLYHPSISSLIKSSSSSFIPFLHEKYNNASSIIIRYNKLNQEFHSFHSTQ
ncbi:hypothetical protein LY90DRAFT_667202 [Neocallimastix californiae]|uniref:Uncharacterized protein n=1 Tax=Neocallimastix californiae TaxID=1754190 RepID=A0A1Y2EM68_9FUNG|nr:hypothetical protein LY90DRAFT_667202 [Neocallimastix californiae]|eukprot:ORY72326.1 hypothetical protein LY90DRAFT_667202 [Neocallimastix californiae]